MIQPEQTADGSYTLFVPEMDEHYHSTKGALAEARHVYIDSALRASGKKEINVLEIGFGTGLNTFLTFLESQEKGLRINYTTFELYPLSPDITEKLNYPALIAPSSESIFALLHQCEWNQKIAISPLFTLYKRHADLTRTSLEGIYDVVYFDAFAPEKQPEMWDEKIFREILPRHGMAVREEQIALCHEVLDTLYNKEISLCEAGVGTGKTLAYLVGCILWQMHRPERMKLPIVISTSSVALQDAILTEYLPDLSAILLDEGIITAPIRKGKERFVCDARLAERASLVQPSRKRQRNSLRIAENILDMDHIPELSRYDRCRICVPQSCPRDCFMRLDCRYQQYLRDSMKPDIQICNHNYLLADASHRLEDRPLLLRSYQALVVDEAHKLPDAARQMYTETLSPHNMDELCLLLQQAHYKDFARQLRTAFLTLSFSCTQGLSKLRRKAGEPFVLTPFRRAALIDCIALLQNAGGLPDVPRYLLNRLGEAESLLRLFLLEVPTRILYIDYDADGQPTFCAASSRVPQLLRSALWNTREPAILTSGTLAAAGDFSHTEQLLGLTTYRPLRHFRADSPFNYKKKCLLYFPPRVKTRMDNRKMAEEIVRLVGACHGHALVLFTAYRQMAEVRALTDGQWQYPTYQAWRNGGKIIQKFKQSGNGVLFAAGSCWEGIDFPGDMVSLLIIAKLPFPIPDPVSDYERHQYPNLRDYINAEIIPEMQKKLRQGFGRAIRTEQDSCVVAILDERAGIGGKYHDAALAALPTCPITEKIEDVQQFIREQKRPDYFL